MTHPTIDAIITSRRKSIRKLEGEVQQLVQLADQAGTPEMAQVLRSTANVKRQRLERLVQELAALTGPELPPPVGTGKPKTK